LLAEAGHPNGIQVQLITPTGRPVRERLGITLQQLAAPGGFDLQIQRVPFSTYDAEVSGKAPLYIDGYFARPTIDTAIYPFYHSSGSWNNQLWLYKDARVDQLLDEARKTNDEAARKAIFEKFQVLVEETVPGIIAYSAAHVNGVSRKVEGFRSTPMQWLELKSVTLKP
jgi:peptide/nickel transport system substrate-binding protein